jgi:hypothetical protein
MVRLPTYLSQIWVLLGQLSGQPDQQNSRSRALDDALCRVLLDHLHQAHPVARPHLVQEANGVVLCHVVCARLESIVRAAAKSTQESARLGARRGFCCLGLPSADNVLCDWEEVVRRDEGGRGDRGVLVDNARLNEALDGLDGGGINDAAEGADRIGAVDDVAADAGVLHDGRGDHDDIVGGAGQLLDDQVDHLAQRGILVLEELRDAEEERRGFVASPALAREEQQGQLGEDLPRSAYDLCISPTLLQHTTLHFRGETGLWLNTRAASCQLHVTPAARWAPSRPPYLLGRPTSCRSARRRPHPRASCPCWAQDSSRRELSRGGVKSIPLVLRQTWPLLCAATQEGVGPRGAIGRGRFAVAGGGCVREGVRVGAVNWCTLKVPRSGQVQGCRECGLLLRRVCAV